MGVGCWAVELSQGLKLFVFEEWGFAAKPLWVASAVAANFGGYIQHTHPTKTLSRKQFEWFASEGCQEPGASEAGRKSSTIHIKLKATEKNYENQSQASTAKSPSHNGQCCNLNFGDRGLFLELFFSAGIEPAKNSHASTRWINVHAFGYFRQEVAQLYTDRLLNTASNWSALAVDFHYYFTRAILEVPFYVCLMAENDSSRHFLLL